MLKPNGPLLLSPLTSAIREKSGQLHTYQIFSRSHDRCMATFTFSRSARSYHGNAQVCSEAVDRKEQEIFSQTLLQRCFIFHSRGVKDTKVDLSLQYLSIVDDIFALVPPWNRRRYPTFACDMCTSIRLELVTEGVDGKVQHSWERTVTASPNIYV